MKNLEKKPEKKPDKKQEKKPENKLEKKLDKDLEMNLEKKSEKDQEKKSQKKPEMKLEMKLEKKSDKDREKNLEMKLEKKSEKSQEKNLEKKSDKDQEKKPERSNQEVLKRLKLAVKFMQFHDINSFKIRAYESAIEVLQRIEKPFSSLRDKDWEALKGVGTSVRQAVVDCLAHGSFEALDGWERTTPTALVALFPVRGLGPKRLGILWRTLDIDSIDSAEALHQACQEGHVAGLKGFGKKTEDSIREALAFAMQARGQMRYEEALRHAQSIETRLQTAQLSFARTGALRRGAEILTSLEWVVVCEDKKRLLKTLEGLHDWVYAPDQSGPWSLCGYLTPSTLAVSIILCQQKFFIQQQLLRTGSRAHLEMATNTQVSLHAHFAAQAHASEEDAYAQVKLPWIPPELREKHWTREDLSEEKIALLLKNEDLQGILHVHSTYSDGKHSLEKMAAHCQEKGYAYLGITDHSPSAFYAHGLHPKTVLEQHKEIQALNQKMKPFYIFKGTESDILADGSLDYPEEILSRFDFVIASIHTGFQMTAAQATERLLRAIAHPHTSILGHPTGRLLLERKGYPIDHVRIIDACAHYGVSIELNASAWRMDLDWRWIGYAQEKNVPLCITPDAHDKEGIAAVHHGVLLARKGGLRRHMTLNAYSREDLEAFFRRKKTKTRPKQDQNKTS